MPAPERYDVAVIGGGPGGAAVARRLAESGARVVVFEKGERGRDKVCGDGLTPRAIAALDELGVELAASHRIDGLRMIANRTVRELPWPDGRYPARGAVWPRRALDLALIEHAEAAGAEVRFGTEALPELDGGRVVGVRAASGGASNGASNSSTSKSAASGGASNGGGTRIEADLTVLATGAPGPAARLVGAVRDPNEPFGLAIRTYVESPRHTDRHIEACLTLRDEHGTPVPGYGWMFPCGDGTVNIGVGALSTMQGFTKLNLNSLLDAYRGLVARSWGIGENLERPRAWRLPMSAQRRHGPGWVAIGDAAGLVNPMNGEGIDYALESGIVAADLFLTDPVTAPVRYDAEVGARFDAFLRTGRRFSFLIGHPWILRSGLRFAVGTQAIADITLAVMANLVEPDARDAAGRTMRAADALLALADPLLRRTRAAA